MHDEQGALCDDTRATPAILRRRIGALHREPQPQPQPARAVAAIAHSQRYNIALDDVLGILDDLEGESRQGMAGSQASGG